MITREQIDRFFTATLVADALGVPVEFSARGTYHLTGMTGHGTYDQPAGTWSDDSSLTLALMANLVANGTPATLMQRFTTYLAGDYTPFGERFDIGNTTRASILAFNHGTPAANCGDASESANGNGALMRLAPLAFSLLPETDPARRREIVQAYTQITHAHQRSLTGSVLYVELLRALLAGQDLAQALATSWHLAPLPARDAYAFAFAFQSQWAQAPLTAVKSSGYVVDTLAAAIWCNWQSADLATVILNAANLGEDTDTVAQIAAAIACAGHPTQTLPKDWLETLVWTPQAHRIIADFAARFATQG